MIDVSMICIEIALSSGQLHFPILEAFLQYNILLGLEVKNGQRLEGEHRKNEDLGREICVSKGKK